MATFRCICGCNKKLVLLALIVQKNDAHLSAAVGSRLAQPGHKDAWHSAEKRRAAPSGEWRCIQGRGMAGRWATEPCGPKRAIPAVGRRPAPKKTGSWGGNGTQPFRRGRMRMGAPLPGWCILAPTTFGQPLFQNQSPISCRGGGIEC